MEATMKIVRGQIVQVGDITLTNGEKISGYIVDVGQDNMDSRILYRVIEITLAEDPSHPLHTEEEARE